MEEYVELVVDAILGRGSRPAVKAFKEGFSTVFPVADLRTFSVEELVMMFGNADEDWSTESMSPCMIMAVYPHLLMLRQQPSMRLLRQITASMWRVNLSVI